MVAGELLGDVFGRKADIGRDFVGGDEYRDSPAGGKAFDGAAHNLAGELFGVADIGVMMVVGIVLSTWQPCGIAGGHHRGLEAFGNVHDGWEDVLHIGDPEIKGAGAENELGTDRIRKRDDALVAVHRRQAGAADAVELDAFGSALLGELDEFLRVADAHDFADKRRQMTVDGDVDIALFEGADVDLGRGAMARAKHGIGADVGGDDPCKTESQAAAQELFHDALPIAIGADASAMVGIKDFVISADGQDIQILPDLLPLDRCQCFDGFIISGDGA